MDQTHHLETSVIGPATILVDASPAAGKEPQWEQAMGELIRASIAFSGHLGTTVLKPVAGERSYRIITKFDTTQNMERWRDSDERQRRVKQLVQHEARPAEIHYVTGLETWFELPHRPGAGAPAAPPKYKMAVIIWIAVYFTVLPLIGVLRPIVAPLPFWLGSALTAAASVALMTWLVMPLLTHLFRGWLYPKLPPATLPDDTQHATP